MKRSSYRRTLLATVALTAVAVLTTLAVNTGTSTAGDTPGSHVAQLRKDIAKYADVQVALDEGFIFPGGECVQSPAGGMGLHYLHPARMQAPVDGRAPQILLYEQTEKGLRLNGAEFFVPDADQDLTTDGDRPTLWGQPFDGPMPGHEAGMPVHYDLHVWTDKANPSGVFAPWNPRVTC